LVGLRGIDFEIHGELTGLIASFSIDSASSYNDGYADQLSLILNEAP
jgi:hypothetical protein